MPDVYLEVVEGPAAGGRLRVDEPLELGREAAGPGALGDDSQLSRRHARVSIDGGRLLIEDMGSTNGTFVNGDQIRGPTALSPGDTVQLGDSTLRLVRAEAGPAPDLAMGGVHAVPRDLFDVLVSRAPVRKEWIVRGALTALAIILAINFIIRTVAIEYLDVSSDLALFKPHVLLFVSVMPVIGNSLGFYENFGRPANHSPLRYLLPGFVITAGICTAELIALPADAGALEYVIAVVITLAAPLVLVPILLGLRVRAYLEAEARFKAAAR
jgi:FHA domain